MKNSQKPLKQKISILTSEVTNAPIIAIPVFIIINYYLNPGNWVLYSAVSIFFVSIIPIIIGLVWVKRKNLEIDMPVKEDRFYPLILVILFYTLGVITLYYIGAPSFTTALMFIYLTNTILVFIINLYWKISIHAMGVSGPAAAIIYLFGYTGILFALTLPVVMWSRVQLKRHTISQVVSGALLGFILTYAQLYVLLSMW